MPLLALVVLAFQSVTPLAPRDFTLSWAEKPRDGAPPVTETFVVKASQVTFSREPELPGTPSVTATIKRPADVQALLWKIVRAKPAKVAPGPQALTVQIDVAAPKPETAKQSFTTMMTDKPNEELAQWVKLRDELRISLLQIPDATDKAPTSVGVATMQANGDLWLRLYSAEPGAPVAEALKIIKPNAPDYESTLKHLGGLKPGESKSIPPFP